MISARDLADMKLKDLLPLQDKLSEAIKDRKASEAKEVRQELAETARRKGFSLDEIFGRAHKAGKGYKATMVAKYRNPEDPIQTWTGKGRKPNWLVAQLGKNKNLDEFRV